MFWPQQTQLITMHTQIDLQDKGCAIKGLIFCYAVWLGSVKGWVLRQAQSMGLVPCCGQDGYQGLVQQHPIET